MNSTFIVAFHQTENSISCAAVENRSNGERILLGSATNNMAAEPSLDEQVNWLLASVEKQSCVMIKEVVFGQTEVGSGAVEQALRGIPVRVIPSNRPAKDATDLALLWATD